MESSQAWPCSALAQTVSAPSHVWSEGWTWGGDNPASEAQEVM